MRAYIGKCSCTHKQNSWCADTHTDIYIYTYAHTQTYNCMVVVSQMCGCIYIRVRVYLCADTYIKQISVYLYVLIHMHIAWYIHIYTCMRRWICIGMCTRIMCVYVCMHACMDVCTYVCTYVGMYVCMYACVCAWKQIVFRLAFPNLVSGSRATIL